MAEEGVAEETTEAFNQKTTIYVMNRNCITL